MDFFDRIFKGHTAGDRSKNGLSLSRNNQNEETGKTLVDFNQGLTLSHLVAGVNDGLSLNKAGRYQEALIVSEKMLSSYPTWVCSWMDKGYALLSLGRYHEALAAYNKAISIDPSQDISWNNKAVVLNFLGQYQEALIASEKALSLNPRLNTASRNNGYALLNMGRYQEALAVFDKILSLDPNYSISWNDNAAALNFLGQYQEALIASEKALSFNPNLATAWRNKGYALDNLGRNKEARDSYNKVLLNDQDGKRNRLDKDSVQKYAEKLLYQANNALTGLQGDGAIVSLALDPIRRKIDEGNYNDAVSTAETAIADLTRIRELYENAKVLKSTVTDPEIIVIFDSGRYEEFVRTAEEQQETIRKITDLKEKGGKLLAEMDQFARVPINLCSDFKEKFKTQDIPGLESAITGLEAFRSSAKPELELGLENTIFTADRWLLTRVSLKNTGAAHATDVRLSFSDEFQTKGIKPVSVPAGSTTHVEFTLLPKNAGTILLEVVLTYYDADGKGYKKVQEFWIEVLEKSTTMPPATPVSPVGRFTPGPLTPRQLPPDLFDHYTDSEFIGKGGFARVFKAKRKDGKIVAVKIPISMDATTGRSFIAEMQNWTKLSHPNIVQLYDFNIMPMPYFEEELCEGSLADQVKPIESQGAAWILFNICEGLKFAHDHKIIHRDLKPQNILLKNGIPKISDWGLSRIISESTTTTSTSFTPFYAAPEQIQNKSKDKRTDIWQLGVILYELITGTLPFTGDSMVEIGMSIATKDPKYPGEINPNAKKMDSVVMKCLEKDPAKRYQSVIELQKDLAVILKIEYKESLRISAGDFQKVALYCGKSFLTQLKIGELHEAYKDLLDLIHCSKGDVKTEAQELSEQIKMRMENGFTEVPDELIQKAEIIVHKVSMGFGNKR